MRTFSEFLKSKAPQLDEAIFTKFFANRRLQQKVKTYSEGEYGESFQQLMRMHNQDAAAAVAEFERLISTPVGQHKLLQMASRLPSVSSYGGDGDEKFRARSTSSHQMMYPQGTSYKADTY